MKFLYSVILLLLIAGTGCSKNNIVPNQEETEVNPFQEIEEEYGISISDKEDVTKLLHVVESGTILSVNYAKSNNEISVLVFDIENKKELGKFNLNKESVIVGKDDKKKELKAIALIINRRMSDFLYGYLYFSEIGSVDVDSYQLFSSKINSNKPISNNIFVFMNTQRIIDLYLGQSYTDCFFAIAILYLGVPLHQKCEGIFLPKNKLLCKTAQFPHSVK